MVFCFIINRGLMDCVHSKLMFLVSKVMENHVDFQGISLVSFVFSSVYLYNPFMVKISNPYDNKSKYMDNLCWELFLSQSIGRLSILRESQRGFTQHNQHKTGK
jgi:hypothetical protein